MAQGLTPQALGQVPATSEPFRWGKGGRRMTPDQLAREQQIAASLMQADYSPVQHWTQGLARLAGNVVGNIRQGRADKAADQNAAESNQVLNALLNPSMSPGGEVPSSGGAQSAVAAALANPYIDDATKKIAMQQYQAANKRVEPIEINGKLVDPATLQVLGDYSTPQQPHYWETNNGSLAMVGADGKPSVLYEDPTPKINWVTADNGDGTKQLVPIGPNGPISPQGGGALPTAPVGKLTPIQGGASPTGSRTFR